jgi:hypothetical protein
MVWDSYGRYAISVRYYFSVLEQVSFRMLAEEVHHFKSDCSVNFLLDI